MVLRRVGHDGPRAARDRLLGCGRPTSPCASPSGASDGPRCAGPRSPRSTAGRGGRRGSRPDDELQSQWPRTPHRPASCPAGAAGCPRPYHPVRGAGNRRLQGLPRQMPHVCIHPIQQGTRSSARPGAQGNDPLHGALCNLPLPSVTGRAPDRSPALCRGAAGRSAQAMSNTARRLSLIAIDQLIGQRQQLKPGKDPARR